MLPNFLIVGAQRSGTTYLHRLLSQHPEVFLPDTKELHYFDNTPPEKVDINVYASYFSKAGLHKAIGEATPCYMYYDWVPPQLAEHVGNAHLIFLLRNPVERAYSNYWQKLKGGNEIYTFERALKEEEARTPNQGELWSPPGDAYIGRGRYAEQVRRFLTRFPRNQLKFLISEELYSSTASVLRDVEAYLELPPHQYDMAMFRNHAKLPKYPTIYRRLNRLKYSFRGRLLWRGSKPIKSAMARIPQVPSVYPPMAPKTRQFLQDLFAPDVAELEAIIGRDLSIWFDARSPK